MLTTDTRGGVNVGVGGGGIVTFEMFLSHFWDILVPLEEHEAFSATLAQQVVLSLLALLVQTHKY